MNHWTPGNALLDKGREHQQRAITRILDTLMNVWCERLGEPLAQETMLDWTHVQTNRGKHLHHYCHQT